MSFSEALFPVEPNIVLSPDPSTWSDTIIDHLVNKYPALSSFVGEIIYTRIDKIDGNAVGVITLVDRPQRIPFIIDSRKLDSLDVYVDGPDYFPLNAETSEKIVSRMWPFKLVSETERRTLTKTAESLSVIGHVPIEFIEENKEAFIKIAEDNPSLLDSLYIEPKEQDKIENKVYNVFVKSASSDTPIVVKDIKENKEYCYSMKKFAEEHGRDRLMDVISNDNIYISNFEPFNELDVMNKIAFEKTADSFHNSVLVETDEGKSVLGKIYPLMHLNPEYKSGDNKIFITTGGTPKYKIATSFKVNYSKRFSNDDIKSTSPKVGGDCVLIHDNIAYGPFKVKAIQIMEHEKVFVVESDFDTYVIKPVYGLRKLVLEQHTLLMPSNSYLCALDSQLDSYNNGISKVAAVNVTISKLVSGKFKIMDGGVSGISTSNLQDVSKSDAISVLMHCGLSEQESKYALSKSLTNGSYSFQATTPMENSQVEKKAEEDYSEVCDKIIKLAKDGNLLKFAAFNDKSNVDEALALNIVTPMTVKKYALLIPSISSTISSLCKFLITKRLNKQLISVDENELQKAISSLYKINLTLGSI